MNTLRKKKQWAIPLKHTHWSLHLYTSLTIRLSFCWCSIEMVRPLIWPEYMKHEWLIYSPLSHLTALFLNAEVIYTHTIELGLWGVETVCVDGVRWAACLRESGGGGDGGGYNVKGIHFVQTACLAGYSSGTASNFLPKCSTCSISKQQNDDKKRKKEQTVKRLERKHKTQNDKKHIQSHDPK